jgi:hypothetical protein
MHIKKIVKIKSKSSQENFLEKMAELDWKDRLVGLPAGICSGATKLIVGHPFDTIKIRMQTEGGMGRFKGPMDCLKETIRKEGVRALYKGATPPLLGWTLMDSTQMMSLNNFRYLLQQQNPPGVPLSVTQHGIAGLGAGICVSFVATPVELLKAKMQVQYERHGVTRIYSSPWDAARKLVLYSFLHCLLTELISYSFRLQIMESQVYIKVFTDVSYFEVFSGFCGVLTKFTVNFSSVMGMINQQLHFWPGALQRTLSGLYHILVMLLKIA